MERDDHKKLGAVQIIDLTPPDVRQKAYADRGYSSEMARQFFLPRDFTQLVNLGLHHAKSSNAWLLFDRFRRT